MGLGRPADPVATLEKRPTTSPCSPKSTASLGTRSTACGRQVLSLGNAWRRRGGQRALLLHPPALPNSRSGHRCDGGRLLVDLGRSVDLEALRPLARRNRCRHRSRSRSARAHGLPRPGGLADGRVGRHGVGIACATFLLGRERVKHSNFKMTDEARYVEGRGGAPRSHER